MKRVIIVGASGMVGGYALRSLLEDPAVEGVTSIGRRNLGGVDATNFVAPHYGQVFRY